LNESLKQTCSKEDSDITEMWTQWSAVVTTKEETRVCVMMMFVTVS